MKYVGTLLVVRDIERAKKFYNDLFGLETLVDNDGNMMLSNGIFLQEEKYWNKFLDRDVTWKNNSSELYFEEENLEAFDEKLQSLYPNIEYVNHIMTHSWGQKVMRFYDLDGNLIEVGVPV